MPLYEYKCQQCHRHTEKRQKFSDPEITVCPHCGGNLQRVISAPNIAFKGGGWYKDLYSSTKPASSNENQAGESKGDAPRESQGESKGESKAEPRSEAKGESKGDSAGKSETSGKTGGDSAASSPSTTPAPAAAPSPTPSTPSTRN